MKNKKLTIRLDINSKYKDKSKEELLDKLADQIIENLELKRKLRRYENPHTPSSKSIKKNRTNFISKTGLGVGKKTGYKGKTRILSNPTESLINFDNICSQCGKFNNPVSIKTKIYEEIPDPQPTRIIKAKWGIYKCKCGHSWESKKKEVPDKGLFGKNLQTQITLLRFDDRLPLRKTISAIERQYKTKISSKAVYDITKRVADKITPEYEKIKQKIRKTTNKHIDETKIKIQGKTHWLWVFRSKKNIFFIIHNKRNKEVLNEVLGQNYKGIIICDGMSAYKTYTDYLQRCWAHILRETKEMAEIHDDAIPLHNSMKRLFKVVNSVRIKDPPDKRKEIYDKSIFEMKQLIDTFSSYKHLARVITKIKNGLNFWFTRIIHPQIEATNNNAERSLRELVVIKRIIGTLRNKDGAGVLAKIMTLISTWKLNQRNVFYSLREII